MKKTILYTVCLAVLTMTGCDKTVLEFPENGGIDPTLVNVNLTLAIDPKIESYEPSERSKVSEADLHDVRWIVEVFRDEIGGDLAASAQLRAGGGRTSYNPYFADIACRSISNRSVDGLCGQRFDGRQIL